MVGELPLKRPHGLAPTRFPRRPTAARGRSVLLARSNVALRGVEPGTAVEESWLQAAVSGRT